MLTTINKLNNKQKKGYLKMNKKSIALISVLLMLFAACAGDTGPQMIIIFFLIFSVEKTLYLL